MPRGQAVIVIIIVNTNFAQVSVFCLQNYADKFCVCVTFVLGKVLIEYEYFTFSLSELLSLSVVALTHRLNDVARFFVDKISQFLHLAKVSQ